MAKVIGGDALGALKTWILNKLSGKSDTGHTHDGRYYTESEIDTKLSGKGTYSKPSTGIPKTDLASAVQTSLGKADSALQSLPSHNHDDRYYTESEIDTKLSGKANTSAIPTKTSQLTNDSGFLTSVPSHNQAWSTITGKTTVTMQATINGTVQTFTLVTES